jgi:hypothetical protein
MFLKIITDCSTNRFTMLNHLSKNFKLSFFTIFSEHLGGLTKNLDPKDRDQIFSNHLQSLGQLSNKVKLFKAQRGFLILFLSILFQSTRSIFSHLKYLQSFLTCTLKYNYVTI